MKRPHEENKKNHHHNTWNMIPNQDAKFLSNIVLRDLSINNNHNFSPRK